MTALLEVKNLSVAFGDRTVVEGASFTLNKGETLALVGESGSGKSVSALSILKLLQYPPASHPTGQILFKGQDLLTAPEPALRKVRGRSISMIFQEPMTSLNPLHTVEKQIGETLSLHQGLSGGAAQRRVAPRNPRQRQRTPAHADVQELSQHLIRLVWLNR